MNMSLLCRRSRAMSAQQQPKAADGLRKKSCWTQLLDPAGCAWRICGHDCGLTQICVDLRTPGCTTTVQLPYVRVRCAAAGAVLTQVAPRACRPALRPASLAVREKRSCLITAGTTASVQIGIFSSPAAGHSVAASTRHQGCFQAEPLRHRSSRRDHDRQCTMHT